MTSKKVRGPKCIWLTKLATQFWLKKDLIGENIFILGKEIQIWIGTNLIRILKCLINFTQDFITRKSVFGVNMGINWKQLKYEDLIGFLGGLIEWIRGLILRILKLDGQLGTWYKILKIKDQTEKDMWFYVLKLTKSRANLKLKVWW